MREAIGSDSARLQARRARLPIARNRSTKCAATALSYWLIEERLTRTMRAHKVLRVSMIAGAQVSASEAA